SRGGRTSSSFNPPWLHSSPITGLATSGNWPMSSNALILSPGSTLIVDETLGASASLASDLPPAQQLEEIERAHILAVLEACQWRIKGAGQAAERLGLHPSTLYSRMRKLGIERQL